MLAALLAEHAWSVFLVFARLGAAFAVLPGFSEAFVPARIRLILAGAVTFAVAPTVAAALPRVPPDVTTLSILVIVEIVAGLFIGLVARMTLAAAHVAGLVIGFQTSLANAIAFDPGMQQQGIVTSAWMSTLAVVVLLAGDFHHMLLRALVDSYTLFPAGRAVEFGEFAEAASQLLSRSFSLGTRMAMPFLVYGIVLFAALGLMQRLMPQLQVFFVAMPLQLALGFILLAASTGLSMAIFVDELQGSFASLLRSR